ncbi:hypothetical protein IE53DRAFT_159954 [Violaceomyces palustris]|uniref:Uncharacterized protein n=1 Tax=Violaceomyces palustris TaxID=1673888 RepID=A0ACD0NTN4_9BASI|nr:hypothetical protein IE53DRAFT_159954 [Violaceomyces palustris]
MVKKRSCGIEGYFACVERIWIFFSLFLSLPLSLSPSLPLSLSVSPPTFHFLLL